MRLKDALWFSRDPVLLTRRNIRLFFRYVALYALAIQSGLAAVSALRNRRVPGDEYGAILVSEQVADSVTVRGASVLAWLGAYPYWTAYFNNRGLKARWFLRGKKTDLERVIRDRKCVSIVLVGHGSFGLWAATDKDVTNDDVEKMMKDQPRKKGEWLQLTCGVDDGFPVKMGELVMDKDRVYTYRDSINVYSLIADALSGFRYIKSLNKKPIIR